MKSFEHDCGLITAYNPNYTEHENKQRNRQLHAKLQVNKYGVFTISDNGHDKFFVLDIKDKGNLQQDLISWSSEYEQPEIHFVEKGGIVDDEVFSYIDSNDVSNYYEIANIMGKWSMTLIANRDWRELNV